MSDNVVSIARKAFDRSCPIEACGWADTERSWYREHLAQHSDDGETRKKHRHPPEVKQKSDRRAKY